MTLTRFLQLPVLLALIFVHISSSCSYETTEPSFIQPLCPEPALGTCTNGRYEDMKAAAEMLKGRRVSEGIRFVVTPASNQELQRAIADGTLTTLIEAEATLTTPGCGTCMGRHQGTLGDHDVCLSTGNRNFKGRMGAPTSQIYLGSPAVAAATAITGQITDPRDL